MDLRQRITQSDRHTISGLIARRALAYQPYTFADDIAVGEGLNFAHRGIAGNVYYRTPPASLLAAFANDPWYTFVDERQRGDFFRFNNDMRMLYDHMLEFICGQLQPRQRSSVVEFGCNSGYFLLGMALRGARTCVGYDGGGYGEAIHFLNGKLGTRVHFVQSQWDGLSHRATPEVARADCVLTIAVLMHMPDILYHLGYLCDRAAQAIFVWTCLNDEQGLAIRYQLGERLPNAREWPLCFSQGVSVSRDLLLLGLREAGFEDIREMSLPSGLSSEFRQILAPNRGYLAVRTQDRQTVLSSRA